MPKVEFSHANGAMLALGSCVMIIQKESAMTRILLILYLALTMGMGPRVCCFASDMVNASGTTLVGTSTRHKCCSVPTTPQDKSGQPDQVPGRCHNLQREGIGPIKTASTTHADVTLVAFDPCPAEIVPEAIGINCFPPPEVRDKLSLLQRMLC